MNSNNPLKRNNLVVGSQIVLCLSIILLVGYVITNAVNEELSHYTPEELQNLEWNEWREPSLTWFIFVFGGILLFIFIVDAIKIEGPL